MCVCVHAGVETSVGLTDCVCVHVFVCVCVCVCMYVRVCVCVEEQPNVTFAICTFLPTAATLNLNAFQTKLDIKFLDTCLSYCFNCL